MFFASNRVQIRTIKCPSCRLVELSKEYCMLYPCLLYSIALKFGELKQSLSWTWLSQLNLINGLFTGQYDVLFEKKLIIYISISFC